MAVARSLENCQSGEALFLQARRQRGLEADVGSWNRGSQAGRKAVIRTYAPG